MRNAVDWKSRNQRAQSLSNLSCVAVLHKLLVLATEIVIVEDVVLTLLCQEFAMFEICSGPPYLSTCPLLVVHALVGVYDSVL